MLDHIAPLCLTFEELLKCFPNLLHYFTFPLAMYEGSNFFTSSLTFVFVHLFDSSYPSGCEIVSHCGFDLHFPVANDAELFLMCLLLATVYLLWRNVCSYPLRIVIGLFVFLSLSCMNIYV